MKFEFWLIDESESVKLLLPVTPGAYEVDYGNDIQIVNATAKGDIPITGYRRLMSIQLEGFFTTQEYPFVNQATYPVTHAMDYVQLIKAWVDKKKIIRLIIASQSITRVNERFYIESIQYKENHLSNDDIDYVITLREFRSMDIKKVEAKKESPNKASVKNKPRTSSSPPLKAKTYKVVSGDNLTKIARRFYGDGNQWKKIYQANQTVIGKNPNIIKPGQVLTIP